MYLYAFGSIVRGELDIDSDIDLLAIVDEKDLRFDERTFSIYSTNRLRDLWAESNPFAWHLSIESRLIYSLTGSDFILELGKPAAYNRCLADCRKFESIFEEAVLSLTLQEDSTVFDLSTIFLSIRNFATCYSIGYGDKMCFSRDSALLLGKCSVPLSPLSYKCLSSARLLSVRGRGSVPENSDIDTVKQELPTVRAWMSDLIKKVSSTL